MATRTDVVVSPIVQSMIAKLSSSELCDFGSAWRVKEQLDELSEVLKRIHSILIVVEEMQIKDELVKILLGDFREATYDADYILDEFIYQVYRLRLDEEKNLSSSKRQVCQYFYFSFNENQILHQHRIAPTIIEIKEKLVEIEYKLRPHYFCFMGSVDTGSNEIERRLRNVSFIDSRPKSSSVVDESDIFGRREDLNYMRKLLLSDQYNRKEVAVFAIYGMGGLGKTTLAQLVYNDPDIENNFKIKAWVCVSESFNIERLTKAILVSATGKKCNLEDLDPLQCKLKTKLRGERFFLVLDDVWNENRRYWDSLRVPFSVAGKGSRILVTTRSQKVSSIMGAIETLFLEGLSSEDCWSLFKKRAFLDENFDVDQSLKTIGKEIVEKCKGLPLAVKTLGGLLCGESDKKQWKSILESRMWDLEEDDILPALSLSYHHLPPHLKLCFSYCSLFHEDYEFQKETLVLLWMAEGFIPSEQDDRMEEIAGKYFDELLHRSFFQRSTKQSTYVMHDLMHDLAQSVSRGTCFRMERNKSSDISKKARHLSLVVYLDSVNKEYFYKCKGLSTFLSLTNLFKHDLGRVPRDLFEALRCLRVLNLTGSTIESLPDSIGNLKHLRYLNLSSTGITELPESTCNLLTLQTLILDNCECLDGLPNNIGDLINLRHMTMKATCFDYTPAGIGKLTFLRTLSHVFIGQDYGFKVGELKKLKHLQGELRICNLENVVRVEEVEAANLKNKARLDRLELTWGEGIGNLGEEAVFDGLRPHAGLKGLTVNGYRGSRFPNWMMTELLGFNKLTSFSLIACRQCKFLPPLGQLPALEILTIAKMDSLEEWRGAGEDGFPCLQKLRISQCPRLRKLPQILLTVKAVSIVDCEALTGLPKLPSVRNLTLENCDERILTSVHQCSSLSSLNISYFETPTSLPPAMLRH